MESEKLNIYNVIEIKEIRKRLIHEPDLLSMFELLCIMTNNRLNKEQVVRSMKIEDNVEPILSDHESDDDSAVDELGELQSIEGAVIS